jgi:hypothetical protein
MFKNIFKSKSKTEKLYAEYEALIKKSHELSTVNRMLSDQKVAEAELILDEIKKIEATV